MSSNNNSTRLSYQIPKEAAAFIVELFERSSTPLSDTWEAWIRTGNANIKSFKVADLKTLWAGLDRLRRTHRPTAPPHGKPRSGSKKDVWIEAVRCMFYANSNNTVDPETMAALHSHKKQPSGRGPAPPAPLAAARATASSSSSSSQKKRSATTTTPTSSHHVASLPKTKSSSSSKKKIKIPRRLQHHVSQQVVYPPTIPMGMPLAAAHNGAGVMSFLPLPADLAALQQGISGASAPAVLWNGISMTTMPNMNGLVTSESTTTKTSSSNRSSPSIKTEAAANHDTQSQQEASSTLQERPANYDVQPQNPQESAAFGQLRQMGFTDSREMLMGIRHVTVASSSSPNSSGNLNNDVMALTEAAMMWIVQQREEAEEARKLDEARRASERTRAERAEQRKAEKKQELLNATVDDLETKHFKGSSLFKQCRALLEESTRTEVLRLLQLEKDAFKWYGTVAPFCYFERLIDNLKKTATLEQIKKESAALEKIMYTLAEQKGGVPNAFLEAQRQAKEEGLPVGPETTHDGEESDDEVVVMDEEEVKKLSSVNTKKSEKSSLSDSKQGPLKNGVSSSSPEVIELL